MRRLFTILAVLTVAFTANAQNFQMHYDFERGHATSTFEMFKVDKWGNTFTFVDFDYDKGNVNSAYYEIARVIKTDKMPIGVHIEYNGGTSNAFSYANAWIFGANYSKANAKWGFSTYAGYKAFKGAGKANWQLTGTWYLNLLDNKFTFSGFADLWSEEGDNLSGDTVFLTEPQIWYHATKNLSLGGEIEISSNFQFTHKSYVRPTLAVKWTF